MTQIIKKTEVKGYGSRYDGVLQLEELKNRHQPFIREAGSKEWDGNTAAAGALLQFWRAPMYAGFPITPSTKWLETISSEISKGTFTFEDKGKKKNFKRIKLMEAEHAVADYLVGAAASCRDLIFSTATSSVGLDHMAETVRSLGASGLGNVMIVNVYRTTANFPICIEGDPSDTFAHRDSGFIQVACRGGQQIYETIIQMPAIGMAHEVMTPTMPGYYGIKDSHRTTQVQVFPDEKVNAFHDELIEPCPFPSLINGDTAMGNIVTSQYFTGFKFNQKQRIRNAFDRIKKVSNAFEKHFGKKGLEFFEAYGFEKNPQIAIVAMGPDAGTALDLLPRIERTQGIRAGLIICRLLTPFPSDEIAQALKGVEAVGVVNNAHHHGRGHLTLDIADALNQFGQTVPIESFFAGIGGANISIDTWNLIFKKTSEAAKAGKARSPFHLLHEGRELGTGTV